MVDIDISKSSLDNGDAIAGLQFMLDQYPCIKFRCSPVRSHIRNGIDEITRLRAALTEALAREAAAFEAAANVTVFSDDRPFRLSKGYRAAIHALTPADAHAALERMVADARVDRMRESLAAITSLPTPWHDYQTDGHEYEDCAVEAIIAKIGSAL